MKKVLLTLLIISFYSIVYSQGHFVLQSVGTQMVILNGQPYSIDSIGSSIPTNYPNFDTLVFNSKNEGSDIPIICNFKPDTSYSINRACCGSNDIFPTSRYNNDSLKYWDTEKDFDKIKNQFRDKPFISIRLKNNSRDSIYAWHADVACKTEFKVISTQLWRLGIPPKGFYWNNITTIVFFKKSEANTNMQEKQTADFLGFKGVKILASFTFRLFDNERFIIVFDEDNKIVNLEYE